MDDDVYFDISLTVSQSLFSDEGDRWITPIVGGASYYDEDGDGQPAGKVAFYHVDLESASERGLDPWYVLDQLSDTAFFMPLFRKVGGYLEFDPKITEELLLCGSTPNLLVFDRIEILPEYRGRGLTKLVVDEVVRLFGASCSLLVLKAFPLQLEAGFKDDSKDGTLSDWKKSLRLEDLGSDEASTTTRLIHYYETLGFQKFDNQGVMYKCL
jgi:GNAT superfamily N-acetyltransferase